MVDKADTITLGDQCEEVIINVAGVELKDGRADKILVAKGVAEGEVTLFNIDSKELTLQGGGLNSIYISGSSDIRSIVFERLNGALRVVVSDSSLVEKATVYEGSEDVILEGDFKNVDIRASDIKVDIKNASIDVLTLYGGGTSVYVDIKSRVESASILMEAEDSEIVFEGSVENILIEAKNTTVNIKGKVGSLFIEKSAKNALVNISKEGGVDFLVTSTSLTLKGEGQIGKLTANTKSDVNGDIKVNERVYLADSDSLVNPGFVKPDIPKPAEKPPEKIDPEADKLAAAKEEAKAKNKSDYTEKSWQKLTVALAAKEETRKEKIAKTKEINDAIRALVKNIPVSAIAISESDQELKLGETLTLSAQLRPENPSNKNIIWKSSDDSIVKINSSGQIQAVYPGKAKITVSALDGGHSDSIAITVPMVVPKISTGALDRDVTRREVASFKLPEASAIDLLDGAVEVRKELQTRSGEKLTLDEVKMYIPGQEFHVLLTAKNSLGGKTNKLIKYTLVAEVTFVDYDSKPLESQRIRYKKAASSPEIPQREGYTFAAWDKELTGITEDTTIRATYSPSTDTKYTVEHYQQNLEGDDYTLVDGDSEVKEGTTAEDTKAKAKTYAGFSAKAIEQVEIAPDGSSLVKVYYDRNIMEVRFVDYDDTELKVEEVRYGGAATAPTDPTRMGYAFDKWDKEFAKLTKDITVRATYSPSTDTKYTVEHYQQNLEDDYYTLVDGDSEVKEGTTAEDTEAKAKTYAGFSARTIQQVSIAPNGSSLVKVYYDRNIMEVRFVDHDGTKLKVEEVRYGGAATAPADPTRMGYAFDKWDRSFAKVIANTTIRATYNANTDTKYSVEHYQQNLDGDDYTLIDTENLVGTTAENTAAKAKTYAGFSAKAIEQVEIAPDGSTVAKVYYDRNIVEVRFVDHDGSELKVEEVRYGGAATAPADPTRMGYAFDKWDKEFAKLTTDTTVRATYNANTDTKYTVKHYQQNLEDDDYTLVGGDSEEKKGTTAENTAAKAKTYAGFTALSFEQKKIAPDGSTVAKVYYDRKIVKVNFVDYDDTELKVEEVRYGGAATAPADPTRMGYAFDKWDKELTGITEDTTVRATYSPSTDTKYSVEHYQQNLEDDYYTLVDGDSEVKKGTTAENTAAKAKTYAGFTALSFEQKKIAPDGSTVAKVYYDRKIVKVNFVDYDGSELKVEEVRYGGAATAPTDPTRMGYAFDKWDKEFAKLTTDTIVRATYRAKTDTSYKVEHYKKNLEDDGYTLVDTDDLTGTTANLTSAEAKSYAGFSAKAFEQVKIAAEGTTVVNIYYDRVIDIGEITGVSIPVAGASPLKTITETDQYTGTVTWFDLDEDHKFNPITVYTATIILEAKPGYSLEGVSENFFTVAGATKTSNEANTGLIEATFPKTGYYLAKDADFSGEEDGKFKYIGTAKYVEIPPEIKDIPVTSYASMFKEASVKGVKSTNKAITDMNYMFRNHMATELDLRYLETSNVTNMSYMFSNCQATSIDLSELDTSSATNMSRMFHGNKATSLDLSSFNTSKVTDMRHMFDTSQATSINLSSFNTSSVTDMRHMFYGSHATSLDLSSFNTSKVTDMSHMFHGSQATSLDLSSFNTSKVTDMSYMFDSSQASALDLSSFDTSKVTDMRRMFYYYRASELNLSSFDTSGVTAMGFIFGDSSATRGYARTPADAARFNGSSSKPIGLTFKVPINNILPIKGVDAPVGGASPVKTITETDQYTGTVTWSPADDEFKANTSYSASITLTAKEGYCFNKVPENSIIVSGAREAKNEEDTVVITAYFDETDKYTLAKDSDFSGEKDGEFKYTGSSEYVVIPSVIKGVPLTSYADMFRDTSVKGVKSTNKNITNMSDMFIFSKAGWLELDGLDTSNVENMKGMFANSHASAIDLSSFDTSRVTNMTHMFNTTKVEKLDLSSFDTSKVTEMKYMFRDSEVKILDLSSFDTSNVTDMTGIFNESKAIKGYARTQEEANKFNDITDKPAGLSFTVPAIDLPVIKGLAVPVTGASPVKTITETDQYTGAVTWSPADEEFQANKSYTATVTLTAKLGYGLSGIAENFFTVPAAKSVKNAADTGVITAVFPKTDKYVLAKDADFEGDTDGEFKYTGTSKYVLVPEVIKGTPVTSYASMFEGTSVEGVKNTNKKITDMSSMFKDGKANSLDLTSLDTSKVTDMSSMFSGSLTESLDLSGFNTLNVINTEGMFSGSKATQGRARTHDDAAKFNGSSGKPEKLTFTAPDTFELSFKAASGAQSLEAARIKVYSDQEKQNELVDYSVLEEGTYYYTVEQEGFIRQEESILVQADTVVEIDLVLLTFTVSFNTNNGSPIEPITVPAKDEKVELPAEPRRVGCTFEGWFIDAELTRPFKTESKLVEDITIYAKWSSKIRMSHFYSHKGSDYKGLNAGWVLPDSLDFSEIEKLEVKLYSGEKLLVTNKAVLDKHAALYNGGTRAFSTPFAFDEMTDSYWAFGDWSADSAQKPTRVELVITGVGGDVVTFTRDELTVGPSGVEWEALFNQKIPENAASMTHFHTHKSSDYKGVNAGWKLANGLNFNDIAKMEVKLYSAEEHLVTNTAKLTEHAALYNGGTRAFSTPFAFDNMTDSYWTFGDWSEDLAKNPTKVELVITGVEGDVITLTQDELTVGPSGVEWEALFNQKIPENAASMTHFYTHKGSDYKGVNAGWVLPDGLDFSDIAKIEVKLYSADGLLVTNEAVLDKHAGLYNGGTRAFSTPFAFDNMTDSYWTFGDWSEDLAQKPKKVELVITGKTGDEVRFTKESLTEKPEIKWETLFD